MNDPKPKYIALCLLLWISLGNTLAASSRSPSPTSAKKLRILSIDGGGVRGVIPARILQEIEEQTGKRIFELFDLVIGNSTGGLVALALVTPDATGRAKYKAGDLVRFYEEQTPLIFHSSLWHKLMTGWGLWGPKYARKNLDKALQAVLGDTKLSQTLKPVLVISYSLDKALPHVWTTHRAQQGIHEDYYLSDVAGATSAAPTYFSPKVIKTEDGNILHEADGGLWANNPEFTAILAINAMDISSLNNEDVFLVSLGTGVFQPNEKMYSKQACKLRNAGIIGWLLKAQPNLIEMMMGADSEWSESVMEVLCPHNHRIQIAIPQALTSMDNSKHVGKLKKIAEDYIRSEESLKHLCDKLVQLATAQAQ